VWSKRGEPRGEVFEVAKVIEALLLAAYLHRSPALVSTVFDMGGLDAVAVVECESNFNETARREEPGGTSYGLFQLYDRYHPQYRTDLLMHIVEGVRFLEECKEGRTLAQAVSVYNGGKNPGEYSRRWGKRVERKRDELSRWLAWRELKAMEVAR
jgi:hypothetical protein